MVGVGFFYEIKNFMAWENSQYRNKEFTRILFEENQSISTVRAHRNKGGQRYSRKICQQNKKIEASGLEKYFKDDYIICLFHEGKKMSSIEFARFLEKIVSSSTRVISFVVGGFLGLEERILKRADFLFSLSQMTFSHELSRIMLLEQIYRSLTTIRRKQYAK